MSRRRDDQGREDAAVPGMRPAPHEGTLLADPMAVGVRATMQGVPHGLQPEPPGKDEEGEVAQAMRTKRCGARRTKSQCGKLKAESAFSPSEWGLPNDGSRSCRECRRLYFAQRRANPEIRSKHIAANRRRRATPEGRAKNNAASRDAMRRRRENPEERAKLNTVSRLCSIKRYNDPIKREKIKTACRLNSAKRYKDPIQRERMVAQRNAWTRTPEGRAWFLERAQQKLAIKRLGVAASSDAERAAIRELDLASVLMRKVFGLAVEVDHHRITVKMARADRSVAHLCHRIANLRIIGAADNSARNQNGHGYSRPCETLTLERLWQEPELVTRLHRLQELRLPTFSRDGDGQWHPTPLPRS